MNESSVFSNLQFKLTSFQIHKNVGVFKIQTPEKKYSTSVNFYNDTQLFSDTQMAFYVLKYNFIHLFI